MTTTEPEAPDESTAPFEDLVGPLFVDYAMSVIADRALPDVRDGLKPVHRRILWSMLSDGYRPDRPHVKCAKVVGAVIGNFHPHGDTALYEALVRLGQTFSLSLPLIDPHGNFGSPSDPPAAYRYTECRLARSAMAMLDGIGENTVDMLDNFDATAQEPVVLPARFPNLLVNGLEGIAVGMATKIPPHNLDEVCRAAATLIKNPDASTRQLMRSIKGPDFPTGGQIMAADNLLDIYETGRGSVRLRAIAAIEGTKARPQIVVTEIPYQTSVDDIAGKAAKAVDDGSITGIRDIRNESAGGGTRLVFDLKGSADPEIVLNQLYKKTPMQISYGCNFVALVDGVPRTLGLKDMLAHWVAHQEEVVTRRTQFRLDKAEARLHIVAGLLQAIDMIDAIIALIRRSADRAEARVGLMGEGFAFTEIQSNHILDMPLGRLTQLGKQELTAEAEALREEIAELRRILADVDVLRGVIVDEMNEIVAEHKVARRTALSGDSGDIEITELVVDDPLVVTVTARGYLSAAPVHGRGNKVATPGEGDSVVAIWPTTSLGSVVLFTDHGRAYKATGRDIPERKLTAAQNLFDFSGGERVVASVSGAHAPDATVALVTVSGTVKRTLLADFTTAAGRRDGLVAAKVADGDRVVAVFPVSDGDTFLLAADDGTVIRFDATEVRPMGRSAAGVRGIKLADRASVVDAIAIGGGDLHDHCVFLVSTTGWCKRTRIEEIAEQGRGGKGLRGIKLTPRVGSLRGVALTDRSSRVLVVSTEGQGEAFDVTEVPIKARDSSGSQRSFDFTPAAVGHVPRFGGED